MTPARRILIVPAAGLGSRLGADRPKLLVPVGGRAMIDHIFDLHAPFVDRFVLVLNPDHEDLVRRHVAQRGVTFELAWQAQPTGMLDAILAPLERVRHDPPDQVWITWCDQIAIRPDTIAAMAARMTTDPAAVLVLPTIRRPAPYIHLVRDPDGRITGVLQRREGDAMPSEGETEMGLFGLSAPAYLDLLPRFAAEADHGRATGERNFIPFIPWAARHGAVHTVPATDDIESIGVNTPDERRQVESYLRARADSRGQASRLRT